MNNLIKLIPVQDEISEIRGLDDLIIQIKKRTSVGRIALLQRVNLDDIETHQDFYALVSTLSSNERQQFAKQLPGDFLNRIIPGYWEPILVKDLVNADNLSYFISIVEKYSLDDLQIFLDGVSDLIKTRVINALNNLLTVKLIESLTTPDIKQANSPLSFSSWPDDFYHVATHWTDIDEDTRSDRFSLMISKINKALHFSRLLKTPQQLGYLKTLVDLLSGIINEENDFICLLSSLTLENSHLLINTLIARGMTPEQLVSVSEHPHFRYLFLVSLLAIKNKSAEHLKLINTVLSLHVDSPEARLALALIDDPASLQNFISGFKDNSFHNSEDNAVRDCLIGMIHSIKNNRIQPDMSFNMSSQRRLALEQFYVLLITNDEYKVKIHALPKTCLNHYEESHLRLLPKNSFFKTAQTQNQSRFFERSILSDNQVNQIHAQIKVLQEEISSSWPFPNKDRKLEKVKGLKALLIKATQMDAITAITEVEHEYPNLRKGTISTRTAQLLDRIRHEQSSLTYDLKKSL